MTFLDWLIFLGCLLLILPWGARINDRLSGRKNFRD
jgi:hypothetical protein